MGSNDNKFYSFNAKTDVMTWSNLENNGFNTTPAIANGVVYATNLNGSLYAFNANTGAVLLGLNTGGIPLAPTIVNGVVYISTVITNIGSAVNAYH